MEYRCTVEYLNNLAVKCQVLPYLLACYFLFHEAFVILQASQVVNSKSFLVPL